LRAAVAGVGAADDGDLVGVGAARGLRDGVRRGEEGEEESCDLGVHFDRWGECLGEAVEKTERLLEMGLEADVLR
jgi:hypothetical protein